MTSDDSFDRAFVAVSCLLGRRNTSADCLTAPEPTARKLSESFARATREERARLLARELSPLVSRLEARRLR